MPTIRPNALPRVTTADVNDAIIIDRSTSSVRSILLTDAVEAVAPLATTPQAEGGTNNSARMTPLRTAEAISAQLPSTIFGKSLLNAVDNTTARTSLGLGDAATKNVGTAAGTVAAGNDARVAGAVQRSGDTLTGAINLWRDPVDDMEPVPLQQFRDKQRFSDRRFIKGLQIGIGAGDPFDDITIAPGVASDDTGTWLIQLPSGLTKTTNVLWVPGGGGGLDTGFAPNFVQFYVWLILNPTSGAVDVVLSQSGTAPTLPSGYTHKRLIGRFYRGDGVNQQPYPPWLLYERAIDTENDFSSSTAYIEVTNTVDTFTFVTSENNTWVRISVAIPFIVYSPGATARQNGAIRIYLDGDALVGNQWNGTAIVNAGQWTLADGGVVDGHLFGSVLMFVASAGTHTVKVQGATSDTTTVVKFMTRRRYQVTLASNQYDPS